MRDNQDQIKEALTAVLDGLPIRQAARQFGVPKSTLFNRLKNPKLGISLGGDTPIRRGREKFLQLDEEQVVVDWANAMTEVGLAPSAAQVMAALQLFLNRQGRHSGFKDNLPSDGWFRRFRARHNLEVRRIEPASAPQTPPTEEGIRLWFNKVLAYLSKDGLTEILADPTRLWTCHEAGFPLKQSANEVVCPSSGAAADDAYYERRHSGRSTVSLVSAVGANGGILRPFVCYPYNRMPGAIGETIPSGWNCANTDSGWMTSDTFLRYLKEHFIVGLRAMNIKFPVLLLVDGCDSHVSFEISEFCSDNAIILFGLHPRSARILQPASGSIFQPLKEFWSRESQKWLNDHPARPITRQNFSPCLEPAWNALTSEAVRLSFAVCGLFPWDPERPDYSLCSTMDPEMGTFGLDSDSPVLPDSPDQPETSNTNGDAPVIDSIASTAAAVPSSALTSALRLTPKAAARATPRSATASAAGAAPSSGRRMVASPPAPLATAPAKTGSLGHMTVGQLVLSELEARIPAEHLHHFRQTRARNGNWTGPVEWLRLYDVWRGLVDQYLVLPPAASTLPAALPLPPPPPPPPPTPVGPQRQQRRARCNSATGQRSVKQPKTSSHDHSFVEWELPVYVELRESAESADVAVKGSCTSSSSSSLSM